jgi:predicted ATPase/DNA-binding winged helix-turn-helix (wHTH) protein
MIGFGPYRLRARQRELWRGDQQVALGGRAFDVLMLLLERPGEIFSSREIIDRVWPGLFIEDANLRVHIANLRKALGDGQKGERYIQTVPRRGYCFIGLIEHLPSETPAPARSIQAVASPAPQHPSIPPALARIVGREAIVEELVNRLNADRFVTLVGAGGVGKTTVALSVAHAASDMVAAGAAFVDLGTLTSPDLVPAMVASAVGLVPQTANVVPGLLAFLRGRNLLIVLDNCEHVIDEVARLAEQIHLQAPRVFILATSREALRVEGETVHHLAPLHHPPPDHPVSAADALSWPAIALFIERARAAGYRGDLSDEDARTVAAICHRLDGIALAIELAAGRVASLGIGGTAELLDHRFKLVWQGRRSALARQQTMLAMLDWSNNLLLLEDRRVLARLSILVGNFTLEMAQAIVSDTHITPMQVAASLSSLVDKSLVSTSPSQPGGYYRLLEITRSYAAVKLEESGEHGELALRHALFCSERLSGHDIENAFGDSVALIGNLRSALEWSFSDPTHKAMAVELTARAAPLFRRHAWLSECLRWCEQALAEPDVPFRGTRTELVLLEGHAVATMFTRGNLPEVLITLQRALAIARTLTIVEDELRLLSWLHIFSTRVGDFRRSLEVAQLAAKLIDQVDHDGARTAVDWMFMASHQALGKQIDAQRHGEAAMKRLPAARVTAYLEGYGIGQRVRSLTVYARILWLRGLPEQAEAVIEQAIAEAESRQHPLALCLAYMYAATVSIWRGDLSVASERIDRLMACATTNALVPFQANGTGLRGQVAVLRGERAAGIVDLRAALPRLDEERYVILSSDFLRALAEALAANGQIEAALQELHRAFAEVEVRGEAYQLPDLYRARGQIGGRMVESDLIQAIAIAEKQGAAAWKLRAAVPLADFWSKAGRDNEAEGLLRDALAGFAESNEDCDVRAARTMVASLMQARAKDTARGKNAV